MREKNEIWIIPAKENDAKTELTDLFEFDNVFIVGSRFFETNPGKKVTKISHLPIQFSSQAVDGRDKTFYGLGILPNERKKSI